MKKIGTNNWWDPTRDNLKIKSIAKYHALKTGDIYMYSEIENQMLDMAALKA